MMIACLLFVLPREMPDFLCTERRDRKTNPTLRHSLLTWDAMQAKFPWGIVMLVGGGYAMADGVKRSGLSDWLGSRLTTLTALPDWVFILICLLAVTFVTEFSSNVATASIFIPLIASVADSTETNPLYLILPITIGCSFAFMLPVATPPNAIVFSAKALRVVDMLRAGFVMNLLGVAVTMLNLHTYAWWLLDLGNNPSWASSAVGVNASSTLMPSTGNDN